MSTAYQSLLARATMFSILVADHEISGDFLGDQPVCLPSGSYLIGWGDAFSFSQEVYIVASQMGLSVTSGNNDEILVEDVPAEDCCDDQPTAQERAFALKTVLRDNRQEDQSYATSSQEVESFRRQTRKSRKMPIVERINLQLK